MSTNEFAALLITEAAQGKILDFVGGKAPPVVITQTPKAGSPVPQGMSIEVKVASKSDIPIGVAYVETVPPALEFIPLDQFEKIVEDNPIVREVKNTGVLTPENEAEFVKAFAKEDITLTPEETQILVKMVKESNAFSAGRIL
jgi:hypothetical protein